MDKNLLELVEKIWTKYPELRLCQLFANCFHDKDLYFVSDEELMGKLRREYDV